MLYLEKLKTSSIKLLCLLFALVCLTGCFANYSPDKTSPMASGGLLSNTASPSASPAIFGRILDNGDIEINKWYLDTISKIKFEFGHAPTILIYHTHTREAFRMEEGYEYEQTEEFRTKDPAKSVVELGRVLKEHLEEYGFHVIHDTTDFENPSFEGTYTRSLNMMESYDNIDLYIDLHRNAADVEESSDDVVYAKGVRHAHIFFVVGAGIGPKFEHTQNDWETNYSLALQLEQSMQAQLPGISRPLRTKADRYNQHMGLCILAEIGHNANTLQDALNAIPYLAGALSETIQFPI